MEGINSTNTNTINYVKIYFSLLTSLMILMGSIVNSLEKYLPHFVSEVVRYGKYGVKDKKLQFIHIPKAWFKHFYVISSVTAIAAFILTVNVYICGNKPPAGFLLLLDASVGVIRIPTVSPACVLLAVSLLLLQCVRRFYDTHFVSVFSQSGNINVNHYIVGHTHYLGLFLAIFGEAPHFQRLLQESEATLQLSDITFIDVLAALTFLWACYHQYKSNVILANLRKNKKGEIVSEEYKLPQGDLFEYVTCPHLFTEKLMYLCLTIILWGNNTFLFVLTWVVANQVETAIMSHWWYKEKFPNFPKNRRILIPFIY